MFSKIRLYQGDALATLKALPSNYVNCIATSPPYFGGLRDYGVDGQLGLEPTPEEHVAKIVEIGQELLRVLHPTGVMFFNYGDCYATGAGSARIAGGDRFGKKNKLVESGFIPQNQSNRMKMPGYKRKDLMGMPWECALALRKSGWYLRSDLIWNKSNALCTSAPDRFPTSHEYLFMLTKRDKYFFDGDSTRELTGNESSWDDYLSAQGSMHDHANDAEAGMQQSKNPGFKVLTHPLGRKKRSVWTIPTEAHDWSIYGNVSHFASFPEALVRPCILSGTSEKGCCSECRKPWIKTYETIESQIDGGNRSRANAPGSKLSPKSTLRTGRIKLKKPTGWQPGCKCDADCIPCVVLDPFSGSGTTALVASKLGRDAIELSLSLST